MGGWEEKVGCYWQQRGIGIENQFQLRTGFRLSDPSDASNLLMSTLLETCNKESWQRGGNSPKGDFISRRKMTTC